MISKDEVFGFFELGELENLQHGINQEERNSLGKLPLKYHFSEWEEFGQILTETELNNLIRGIIYFTKAGGHSGGSVSPIIPLFRVFAERYPTLEPDICHWITENRENDYEPFGTCDHGGALTLDEFRAHRLQKQMDRNKRNKTELDNQKLLKQKKLDRERVAATKNLWNAVRRGDSKAVEALLQKGADWRSVVEEKGSLMELAKLKVNLSLIELLEQHSID